MPDIPVPVWSALIGLLGGVVGVSIGAVLQRRFERKHWERTTRLDVYDEFLRTVDALQIALTGEQINLTQARLVKEDMTRAITRVALVGSNEAVQAARKTYMYLHMLDYAARLAKEAYGDIGTFDADDMKDVYAERWAFIRATRKDVGASPVDIPRKSLLPPGWKAEDQDSQYHPFPLGKLKPRDSEPPDEEP